MLLLKILTPVSEKQVTKLRSIIHKDSFTFSIPSKDPSLTVISFGPFKFFSEKLLVISASQRMVLLT